MPIKVSIVIPTYRRPALLKKCLDSLLLQDFDQNEYEIIIVTDGPDEQTNNMIIPFYKTNSFNHLYCYSLPTKKGPAAARNVGWRAAKGNVILFTDDDCVADRDWVKNYSNAFEFYAETLIAFSGKIVVPVSSPPTDYELNTANLETAEFVTANCACSRAALEMINGFDEAFVMAWREDSDLHFKLLKSCIPVIKIEEAVVIHPARKAPWGISLREQKKSMYDALLFKKHPQLYKEKIHSLVFWKYFLMIISVISFPIAFYFHREVIGWIFLVSWLFLTGSFITKRLNQTSHSFVHVAEMVVTSLVIPFFSLFWNLYGAYRFKVLHI